MNVSMIVTLLAWSLSGGLTDDPETKPANPQVVGAISAQYRDAAERIAQAALKSNDAYEKLEHLCINIGHRLSGSPGLERAIDWAIEAMKKDGQQNVGREKVMVPHWVRGKESATMLAPRVESLHMLGLGGSIGTDADDESDGPNT